MKIVIKNKYLNGSTQEQMIQEYFVTGWKNPMLFDLAAMFESKHTEIEKLSIEHVITDVASIYPKDGFSIYQLGHYELYCLILISSQVGDNSLKEWGVNVYHQHANLNANELISFIEDSAATHLAFAKNCFALTKSAIVSKSLLNTLNENMHNLDFDELALYGSNIKSEFISSQGGINVKYSDLSGTFESEIGFEFDTDQQGKPFNSRPTELIEVAEGDFKAVLDFKVVESREVLLKKEIVSNGYSIITTGASTNYEQALVVMFLCSVIRAKLTIYNDFDGSSDYLEINNAVASLASFVLGIDIIEDDEWCEKLHNADSDEVAEVITTAMLKHTNNDYSKTYIVSFESCFCLEHDWKTVLENPEFLQIWNEENIDEDMGWSESESKELNELKIGDGVTSYSSQRHSIFRVA